jgi:protein phosphatase 1L
MTLHTTVRFFCSVVAAFARLVRELRRAASSSAMSSPVGLIATAPLPLRRKTKLVAALAPPQPSSVVARPAEVCDAVVSGVGAVDQPQQAESKRKKTTAWSARGRPSRLVIPVADDAGELAAGWGAAAAPVKEADVEVEGEGFWLASRAGPRHAMEDAYSVVTHKNGGDSQLVRFFFFSFGKPHEFSSIELLSAMQI